MKKVTKAAARTRTAPSKSKPSPRMVAAATMLVLPMAMIPNLAVAQGRSAKSAISPAGPAPTEVVRTFLKISIPYTILGVADGHTIYKTAEGKYFYVDPRSGDMKMLSNDYYLKIEKSRSLLGGKSAWKEPSGQVTILGVDKAGNVLQKNARGETFYLNAQTGDMVFVKSR